jgi:hypothetical protein
MKVNAVLCSSFKNTMRLPKKPAFKISVWNFWLEFSRSGFGEIDGSFVALLMARELSRPGSG